MQAIHIDFCYSLLILTALTEVDTEGQVLLQARKKSTFSPIPLMFNCIPAMGQD